MITRVTATGDRHEAFELTRMWMASQTRKPDQWIVVDDGWDPMPSRLTKGVTYIRREPTDGEGHTLTLNLSAAVPHIRGAKILMIEDDDWYGPDYITTMSSLLDKYKLVGEAFARYYHLPAMKYRRIGNNKHASLCQTGFTFDVLPVFVECLAGDPYVDSRLWKHPGIVSKYLVNDQADKLHLHCSFKGLKGRTGIGTGHDSDARYYLPDTALEWLIRWVGEDNARIYMSHVGQSFNSAKLVNVGKGVVGRAARKLEPVRVPRVSLPAKAAPIRHAAVPSVVAPKITVITCTGDRPEAFKLCRTWMSRQTRKPDQWIVVDDG